VTEVNPPSFLEWCRECRDEDKPTPADFIIWGKLFPPEALGPKCAEHAYRHVPQAFGPMMGQWAIFDLRGLVRQELAVGT
jgi:hypothetical protein